MAEYIERAAALYEIERREALMVGDKCVSVAAMKSFIKNRPAADVAPVVRCKDCIYTRKLYGRLVCKYGTCSGCILREDFFCANGTRKETRKDGDSDALD